MSGRFRNVFVSSSKISVLLIECLLFTLRLDDFFVILSYNGCFGLRALLGDIKKIKILVNFTFKLLCEIFYLIV